MRWMLGGPLGTPLVGKRTRLLRYQGLEQRSREGAYIKGRVPHGRGTRPCQISRYHRVTRNRRRRLRPFFPAGPTLSRLGVGEEVQGLADTPHPRPIVLAKGTCGWRW